MDAKNVELLIVGIAACGFALAAGDLFLVAFRSGAEDVRPRIGFGVVLTALGAVSFAALTVSMQADAAVEPAPVRIASDPTEIGWPWEQLIPLAVAAMLAAWTVLAALRPGHAAVLLLGGGVGLLVLVAFAASAHLVTVFTPYPEKPWWEFMIAIVFWAVTAPASAAAVFLLRADRRAQEPASPLPATPPAFEWPPPYGMEDRGR